MLEVKNPRPLQPSLAAKPKDRTTETVEETEAKVRTLVEKIEARSIDITGDYEQWVHLGMSLHDMICGLDYWQRISVYRRGSHANDDRHCARKWKTFKSGDEDNAIGYFFNICRDYGITLR